MWVSFGLWGGTGLGSGAFLLEPASPGTASLLRCSLRHCPWFYFLGSFIFSAFLLQREQVPSSPLAQGKLQQLLPCCPSAWGHKANPAVTPHCSWPFSKIHVYFFVTVLWVELLLMLCIIDTEMLNTKK